MRPVEIDRTKWIRGEKDSMLFRPSDGKSCCVGLVCAALGVPLQSMSHIPTIEDLLTDGRVSVPSEFKDTNPDGHYCDCPHCELVEPEETEKGELSDLYSVNDTTELDDIHREAQLIPLFAKLGIDVKFIN